MASIGHLAIGMGAARLVSGNERPSWLSMVAWSALSMLPDADVIGMGLGIPYEDPLGHRGASHSLLFAAVVGAGAGLMAAKFGLPRLRACVIATLVLASHAILDTFTDGGLGCALFWPFDPTRYFAPWRPIPVSPLGLEYLSPHGAFVGTTELILFSPLLLFALRRRASAPSRRRVLRVAFVTIWVVLVWLIGSTDPLRQAMVEAVLRADTEYASGFSEQRFAAIEPGMTTTEVAGLVGAPLAQWWEYSTDPNGQCRVLRFEGDEVVDWRDFAHCTPAGIQRGMATQDVLRQLGPPSGAIVQYSRSRSGGWFHAAAVFFYDGKVEEILRRWSPAESP
jgi:inner membrane protein